MTCPDFDRLWDSDRAEDQATLRQHAADCADCRARLAWEERLAGAVRALRPAAPEDLWDGILAQVRSGSAPAPGPSSLAPVRRLRGTRLLPVAAALLVALGLWWSAPWRTPGADHPQLISEHDRQEVHQDQEVLAQTGQQLLAHLPGPAANERASALLEEARHLDLAVQELQRAVAANPRSRHLNDRLLELSRRRNRLLEAARLESRG